VATIFPPIVADFQRGFDELFDELLIGRWRAPATENEPAMVLEREGVYEVRLCTGTFQPRDLEVAVTEKRLTVRAKRGDNGWERMISFTDPVQTEKVNARWADRVLTVILPKQNKTPAQKNKRPRTERK